MNRRIVKVGGSLLNQPDLVARLNNWISEQSPAQNLFVTGGGMLADCVRQWNTMFQLDDQFAHDTCIELMAVTSRLLHQLMPELSHSDSIPQIDDQSWILDPRRLVKNARDLDVSWRTTSDSIAAWIAGQFGAAELVLLKSVLPNSRRLGQWSIEGLVDPCFEQHARKIGRVTITNFLDDQFANTVAEFAQTSDRIDPPSESFPTNSGRRRMRKISDGCDE